MKLLKQYRIDASQYDDEQKRLVKQYLNDVGLLTNLVYGLNVNAVLQDTKSINLGTVYESVVAQELHARGRHQCSDFARIGGG